MDGWLVIGWWVVNNQPTAGWTRSRLTVLGIRGCLFSCCFFRSSGCKKSKTLNKKLKQQGEFERIFGFSFRLSRCFRPGGTNNINWTPPSRKSWRFHPPRRTAYAFWPRWKRCVGVGGEWCWGRVNALGIGKHKTSGKTGKIHTDPSIWKWIRHVFHWFNFQRFHWFTFSGKFEDEDVESCCKSKISRFSTTKKLAGTTPRQRYQHDFPQIRWFVISGHAWLVGFDRSNHVGHMGSSNFQVTLKKPLLSSGWGAWHVIVRFFVGCRFMECFPIPKNALWGSKTGISQIGDGMFWECMKRRLATRKFQAIKQTLALFLGGRLHELPQAKFHALLFSGNPWTLPSQYWHQIWSPL